MRLAVTRPIEDAKSLKQELVAQGHEVLACPLMTIGFLPPPLLPDKSWQAVVVTSANALKALAAHPQRDGLLSLPCFCVGPASAKLARELGFLQVEAADGGLSALESLVKSRLKPQIGPLLYLSGEQISGDLAGNLALHGFVTDRFVLYRAEASQELSVAICDWLWQGRLDGVLLYSPRSARIWLALLQAHGLWSQGSSILHYCLSANVAAALPQDWLVKIAQYPEDAAMLALVAFGQESEK